jgi:hypothetical protein
MDILNYEITSRDVIEVLFGSLLIIFGIVGSIICANLITLLIEKNFRNINDKKMNIFILFIHIILILVLIMCVRYIASKYILNKLVLDSTFSFIGPTIGASSLYFTNYLKLIVALTL